MANRLAASTSGSNPLHVHLACAKSVPTTPSAAPLDLFPGTSLIVPRASPSPFSCLPLANRPIRVRCPGRRRRGSLSAQVLGPRARWPSTWRTQMRLQERRLSSCSRPQAYATSPTHSGPPRSRRHLPSSRRRPTSQTPRRCCVGSRRTLCHLRERLDNSVSVSGVHRRCNGRYGRPGAAMGGKAGRLDMLGGTVELAALTGAPIPPQPASAGSRPMSDRCSSRLVET